VDVVATVENLEKEPLRARSFEFLRQPPALPVRDDRVETAVVDGNRRLGQFADKADR